MALPLVQMSACETEKRKYEDMQKDKGRQERMEMDEEKKNTGDRLRKRGEAAHASFFLSS